MAGPGRERTRACHSYIQEESLADAKASARQQCVYEGSYRRNLQQIDNMRFCINGY